MGCSGSTYHATLLIVLSKSQRQVAERLCQGLDWHGFVVREAVLLRLNATVVNQGACIRCEPAHCHAHVLVHLGNLFYAIRFLQ